MPDMQWNWEEEKMKIEISKEEYGFNVRSYGIEVFYDRGIGVSISYGNRFLVIWWRKR